MTCPGCGTELFDEAPCCLVCGEQFKQTLRPPWKGVVRDGATTLPGKAVTNGIVWLGRVIGDTVPLLKRVMGGTSWWRWAVIGIIGGALFLGFCEKQPAPRTLAAQPTQTNLASEPRTLATQPAQTGTAAAEDGRLIASPGQTTGIGDAAIDAVRNGVIEDHEAMTVGKAFESAFQNAKWSSVRTPAGQTVVQFDGTSSTEALIASGFVPIIVGGSDDDRVVPVQFQFTLSVYGRTVFVERVASMPFIYVNGEGAGAFSAKRAISFVYKQRFDGLHATAKTTNQLRLAATTPAPDTAKTVDVDPPASHPAAPLKAFNIASLTQRLLRPVSPADLPEEPAVRGSGGSAPASLPVVSQTTVPSPPKPVPAPPTKAVEPPLPTGGQLIPAKAVSRVEPEWKVARLAGASGPVELEATISVDGRVKNPHVLSGNTLLQKPAIDAVLQWRYQPAMLNGKPVDSPVKIKLNFLAH